MYAFVGCERIKEIHIPESVTIIGQNAFEDCVNLEKVYLPDNLERIDETIFNNCEKAEIYVTKDRKTENLLKSKYMRNYKYK